MLFKRMFYVKGEFSKKAFFFWMASFIGLLLPIGLWFVDAVVGKDLLDYYQFTILGFLAAYTVGKKFDNGNK